MFPDNDNDFEDLVVTQVDAEDGGWLLDMAGMGLFLSQENSSGLVPSVGDRIRLYGKFGSPTRGVFLNGQKAYYRTLAEQKVIHQQWVVAEKEKKKRVFEDSREDMDRRVAALPEVFQKRINKFRSNNPDFRWEFEQYELFVCEQAVVIAETLQTVERLDSFLHSSVEEQAQQVPGLDEGHSNNTFGFAVRLAYCYLTNKENVCREHGAMVPLVGCQEYGCLHEK